MNLAASHTPLIVALQQLALHDHLCSIYDNRQECYAVSIPFIRSGLERGEKCIYIADDASIGEVRAGLQAEAIDVDRAIASKSLILTTHEQTYFNQGAFDPDWMFSFWGETTDSAKSEGFSGLRAGGETEWVVRRGPGVERWLEYESTVTQKLTESNCFTLCQYNRQLFPPKLILEVIRTHPIVIYRGTLCRNMYYVPPEEQRAPSPSALEVDRLLANLRERQQVEHALREQHRELRLAREALVENVRQRKRADKALRESEQRLYALAEGLKDCAMFLLDTGGRLMNCNTAAERLTGCRKDDLVAQPLSRLYPVQTGDNSLPEAQLRLAEATGSSESQGWCVRADGNRFWADVNLVVIRGEEEKLLGYWYLMRDASRCRQAEEELRRAQACLAEGEKINPIGTWRWNIPSGELLWSQGAARIFGVDATDIKPSYRQFLDCWVHADDRAKMERSLNDIATGAGSSELDYRIIVQDGLPKHIHAAVRSVSNGSCDPEVVGAIMDLTERDQTKAALESAAEEITILREQLNRDKHVALTTEIDRSSMFEEIVGSSGAVRAVLSRVAKVAPTDSTVLITGETGTGKELIAHAIHKGSKRAGRAFIGFNCAGVPSTLIASELFGHEKGAFTGAQQRRLGRFELAEGGTIFLDEVGELPAETQVALLRVLQEREFERVGGSQPISTDVRVIAATNRDLQVAVAAGTFRLDLYYRLNVFPIEVPPLRDRKEDIAMLLEHFIKLYARQAGKEIRCIDKRTIEQFKAYHWPGNIRELQNLVERSVIMCDSDVFSVDESWPSKALLTSHRTCSNLSEQLLEQEKKIIEAALAESKGRVSGNAGAAAKLGIPSSTLESKIKILKIRKNSFKSD